MLAKSQGVDFNLRQGLAESAAERRVQADCDVRKTREQALRTFLLSRASV